MAIYPPSATSDVPKSEYQDPIITIELRQHNVPVYYSPFAMISILIFLYQNIEIRIIIPSLIFAILSVILLVLESNDI